MYSFRELEPVGCSMSGSHCCFLTCIHISQEADQVIWYSHLLKNFPQFVVIHTVEGFGIVNKVEVDVFLELSCFFNDPTDVGNLISGSSAFSKSWLLNEPILTQSQTYKKNLSQLSNNSLSVPNFKTVPEIYQL